MTPQEQEANFLRNNQGAAAGIGIGGAQQQGQQGEGNMSAAFMQHLASLPPDEREAIIRKMSQDFKGQGGIADERMAQAQATMDADNPEGRQAGRMYVAANPLEHLASGLRKYKAKGEYASALDDKKTLSDSYAEQSGRFTSAGVADWIKGN